MWIVKRVRLSLSIRLKNSIQIKFRMTGRQPSKKRIRKAGFVVLCSLAIAVPAGSLQFGSVGTGIEQQLHQHESVELEA